MAFLREVGLEHEWQRVDRVALGVEELGGAVRDHRQRRSTPCVCRDRSSATEGVPEREAAGCQRREHLAGVKRMGCRNHGCVHAKSSASFRWGVISNKPNGFVVFFCVPPEQNFWVVKS